MVSYKLKVNYHHWKKEGKYFTHSYNAGEESSVLVTAYSYDGAVSKAKEMVMKKMYRNKTIHDVQILSGRSVVATVFQNAVGKPYVQINEKNMHTVERPTTYVITGTDARGVRFKPIYTNNPGGYNIYSGTLWKLDKRTGKRTKVRDYY